MLFSDLQHQTLGMPFTCEPLSSQNLGLVDVHPLQEEVLQDAPLDNQKDCNVKPNTNNGSLYILDEYPSNLSLAIDSVPLYPSIYGL